MPRIARVVVPHLPHHITQRGNNRQDVFFEPDDYRLYLWTLKEKAQEAGLRVLAYCLLSNHVHLVVIPQAPDSLAVALGRTHFNYTQWVNHRYQRSGHLWQNRYHSCVMDDQYAEYALVYVEQNPVRAGLAQVPWQYEWSSARAHVTGRDDAGLLDLAWWQSRWEPREWRRRLAAGDAPKEAGALRRHTATGRPLGSEAFVARLEAETGRRLQVRPPGRPKN